MKKSGVVFKKRLQVVYSLLEKGFRSLTPRFPYTIHRPILKSDSPAHDLGLGDLWGRLEACQMVESISSENMIQTCEELVDNKVMRVARSLHSDGVVEVDSPKGKFLLAIEYEISDKSASRYTAKLLDYYLATAIPAVLYICGNARIRELIFQADGELGKKFESKVYTCLEENFHANKAAVEFQSYQGDTFYLK